MPGYVGAMCGLTIFAAMVLRGLVIGNPAEVVVSRALAGLFVGVLIGALVGRVAQRVVQERPAADGPHPPAETDAR